RQGGQGVGRLWAADYRAARLDEAPLLRRDRVEGVAQDGGVVVADRGDDGDGRGDDVGGVESPAESDLDHADLNTSPSEGEEGERGGDLEGGGLAPVGPRLGQAAVDRGKLGGQGGEVRRRDRLAADL